MNSLQIIEHQNQRVLTTALLAESFGTESDRISKNFSENRERFTEGKHFFKLDGDSLLHFRNSEPQIEISSMTRILYLWTEKGAWMHAKSLNTDQAWAAYELLVDHYYTMIKAVALEDLIIMQAQSVKELKNQVARLESTVIDSNNTISAIQETFLQRDEDWRKSMNSMLNAAAYRGGGNYRDLRADSYKALEERAHCDLDKRLRNLVERLERSGATKTQLKNTSRMDVIEVDPRLKEIYSSIVKEISIGTLKIAK